MTRERRTARDRRPEALLDQALSTTRFFPLPRPGFDPLTAKPAELLKYGLPAKPDADREPARYAFWHKMFSFRPQFLEPGFSVSDLPLPSATAREGSRNWSGAYLRSRDGLILTEVHGAWQVPVPSPPPSAPTEGTHEYRSSVWIGFDGQGRFYHSSLPQIGSAQIVKTVNGVASPPSYSAWCQWWARDNFSEPPVTLSLKVDAGDLIMCSAIVEPNREGVKFIIKNASSGHIVSPFVKLAPRQEPALKVSGATAEWIMERPAIWPTDELYDLPDYGTVLFNDCLALAASPRGGSREERVLRGASLIGMYEARQNPQRTAKVSVAKLINERQVMTTYR